MKQDLVGRPFRALIHYNLPYKWHYLGGAALALAFTSVELGVPLVIRRVVGLFETDRMTPLLLWLLVGGLLLIAVAAGVSRYCQRMLMIGASRRFEYDLRNELFAHVQTLGQDYFRRTKTGDIMARATNDLNYVRSFIGPGVMGTVDLVRVPFTLAVMLYLGSTLTLYGLAPLPVLSLVVYAFVMYMHRQSKRVQDQFSVVSSRAQENLAGARVVKAYGVSDREYRDFEKESRSYMRESLKLAYAQALVWPVIELMLSLVILTVTWKGGSMVIHGAKVTRPVWTGAGLSFAQTPFTLADFSGFTICLVMLAFPLTQFGWVMTLYQRGAVGMGRILDVLGESPSIADGPETRHDITAVRGAVQFDRVSFRYGEADILHEVSFDIAAGETAAIVGPTGSGKSSIVSLLTREYDPTTGAVLIDGVDARCIPLRVLRGAIGYVPQDTFLFSDTIRENVAFGVPDADDARILEACEIAQLTETIAELPDGLDTLLGERGVNLSGGQKQRLAIARALVRDPAILILDDALSSVDTRTEERILEHLRAFMAERTSILISHRVSTVRHADQILVVDEGRIVERGRHGDLIARGGLYEAMHRRQLLEDRLEEE